MEIRMVPQEAWKSMPTKSRSNYYGSDSRITFGKCMFWFYLNATGGILSRIQRYDVINSEILVKNMVFCSLFVYMNGCHFITSGADSHCNFSSFCFLDYGTLCVRSRDTSQSFITKKGNFKEYAKKRHIYAPR